MVAATLSRLPRRPVNRKRVLRVTKALMRWLGVAHRRGGYRDPESQAFIESLFDKMKRRGMWLRTTRR